MSKGITPVVTMILLLVIVIVVVGLSFGIFSNLIQTTGTKAEQEVRTQSQRLGENFVVEGYNGSIVYIRNTGYSDISGSSIAFYANGQPVDAITAPDVSPGEIAAFELNPSQLAAIGSITTLKVSGNAVSSTLSYNYTVFGFGNLSITTTPSYADVYLDSQFKGNYNGITPIFIQDVSAGLHTLRANKTGYVTNNTQVNVIAGVTTPVDIVLQLMVSPGSLNIDSTPNGAGVYLNGSLDGTTPAVISKSAGLYNLNITLAGYYDYISTVLINSSTTTLVNVTLVAPFCGDTICNNDRGENEFSCIQDCPTTSVNVYLALDVNETFVSSSGYSCSRNLWSIENNKINFSISSYPTISNAATKTCNINDAFSTIDLIYTGMPMRIQDFQSTSSYRINEINPNRTLSCGKILPTNPNWYCWNLLTYINSSSPENYSILPNGMLFNFTTQGAAGLRGNISYRVTDNSNYVRVDAIWENFGPGNINDFQPGLEWGQAHPPHGIYKSSEGVILNTSLGLTNLQADNWTAFWPEAGGYDDVLGWIVNSSTEAIRFRGNFRHILIYKENNITVFSPGMTYRMTFYIYSGMRGAVGDEWQPVNQTFCQLFPCP